MHLIEYIKFFMTFFFSFSKLKFNILYLNYGKIKHQLKKKLELFLQCCRKKNMFKFLN